MTYTRTGTAIAALLTGLAAGPVLSQDVFAIDEIVISANLGTTGTSRTGASVSLLDAEEIEKTGETRLTDTLSRLPGVGVLSRGPVGTQTGLTIRGASQNYIKVLVDGIDVADPSAPQVAYDFGRLTNFGLDRIEVLRGSQSALYGSQAIAGVISLGTALPEDEGISQEVALEAGSYGTVAGRYGFGIRSGAGALGLTLSHVVTDGYSAANEADGNTEADGYEATRLSLRGETEVGEGVTLGFSGFLERTEGDYDEQFPLADGSPDELSTATSRGLRVFARFGTGAIENEVFATVFSIDRSLTGSTGFGGSVQDFAGRRQALGWSGRAALGAGTVTFGADTTRESYGQASDFGFGVSTNGDSARISGAFVEWDAPLGEALDVTATARIDDHSAFGTYVTGRVAAAWRLSDQTILRASAGTGFRAPSGYELFGPFGDATLEPEESTSLDLGIEQRFGAAGYVRATLFRIETENLIDYSFPNYFQTTGTTLRQGLELEAGAALGDRLLLTGAYTFTDSENPPGLSAGNTWNTGFGRHQLALGLDAEVTDRLTASFGVLHVAERPTLPDYTVTNATLTYDLGNAAEVFLRVENLTDEDYELVEGYGTSGRAVYVGLRKSF